jgi:divalent metal cation (Fe/Co/Zn/Cd) transporter
MAIARFQLAARREWIMCVSGLKDGSPFGLAGLWENWRNPNTGDWERTFAVITRLCNFIKISKDPTLISVLLEDSAALAGLAVAAAGVIASCFFRVLWADGAASVMIGLLLILVAMILANEIRSLIAGEAVAPFVLERLHKALARIDCITDLEEVATLHLGPGAILVALTLSLRRDSTTDMLNEAIREITEALRKADGRVAYVYVRPSQRKSEEQG